MGVPSCTCGTAALHLDRRAALEVVALDLQIAKLAVTEGSVNARVRDLSPEENFEIGTPQLALRAVEPGEWRIDVDPAGGFTRVAVRSGAAVLYGDSGTARRMQAGQQMVFTGRELTPLAGVPAQPQVRPERHDERGQEGHKTKAPAGALERKSGAISSGSWRANG
jgi:uncharacterized cupin superfamily protein